MELSEEEREKRRQRMIKLNKDEKIREMRRQHALTNNPSKNPEVAKKIARSKKGVKLSERHRNRIKKSMQKYRGENNPAKRPEVREKISKSRKGVPRPDLIGNTFNGQFSFAKALHRTALLRDNFQCQHCHIGLLEHKKKTGRALSMHHIDQNPKNNRLENLITLCSHCHMATHNKLGRRKKQAIAKV